MALGELAQEMGQRGFEAVRSGDHSHIPATMKTPFPADGGIKQQADTVQPALDEIGTLMAAVNA